MKKSFIRMIIIINTISAILCIPAQAFVPEPIITISKFSKLYSIINAFGDPKSTLLVMDDDDTLTMMGCYTAHNCQYLGGPAWYAWQTELLTQNSPYRVAKNSEDLLKISTLLFSINYMNYTQTDIPSTLEKLTKKGVKLLVETARGPSNLSATVNQFTHLSTIKKSIYTNFLDLINKNSLIAKKSAITSIACPFLPCGKNAPNHVYSVSYQQGVMYAAGQNKGMILKCLLKSTLSSSIKNIVFIDDTLTNVQDVHKTFKNSNTYAIKAIHYTALDDHKKALTRGSKAKINQELAQFRWNTIKDILNIMLLESAIPSSPTQ
ncbi:MAG: DUF2608 domain-containing protein [Alteromonadaceae bacterium]|nr:DUF2608 domain-containing protein [Alteromonadaceae bacterium]